MAALESSKAPKTISTNPPRTSRQRCFGGAIHSSSEHLSWQSSGLQFRVAIRYCTGWALPSIQSCIGDRNLHSAVFNWCTVGVEADGQPAKKPWRFITSSLRLASNLAALKCTHSSHAPLQGKWTRMSAVYLRKLCNMMIQSLFPHVVNQHVCSMPCVARSQQSHRQKLVPGYPWVPLDIAMFKVGCKEVVTPAYVHRLLDRSEWKDRPEVLDAINSEKEGLLANGTWDASKIKPQAEVLAEARAKGQKTHVGALLVVVSFKGYEKSISEWVIKARIVFRGDAVRDEANQAAVFDELAASAPTSRGGLNMIIAFGLVEGTACSTSACIKAYQGICPELPWLIMPNICSASCRIIEGSCQAHSPACCATHPIIVWSSSFIRFMAESSFHSFIQWIGGNYRNARTTQLLPLPIHESSP